MQKLLLPALGVLVGLSAGCDAASEPEPTQQAIPIDAPAVAMGDYELDIGGPGALPGQFDGVHQINVDQEGHLYVTEIANDRSQKFRPKPDADPAKLIGRMVGSP